ncbi:hypothetical protein COV82_05700 [Candidatus Peregrinibacteria bacterium CG11_big_fil_rev_8_21_14_0_20_46_8]|nr:MAG: hypothetical protein COV82_05700 [Candidatus Peregrinibacteria bacterium CG11_big_fil_rev_8_21_14_0_20_46_8]
MKRTNSSQKFNPLPRLLIGLVCISTLAAGCGGTETKIVEVAVKTARVRITPVNEFDRVVPDAPVYFDEVLEGYGPVTVTYNLNEEHFVRIGTTRKYFMADASMIIELGEEVKELRLSISGFNLAETCFKPVKREKNSTRLETLTAQSVNVNGAVLTEQQRDGTYCETVDAESDVRAYAVATGDFQTSEFAIPADKLEPGISYTFELFHVPAQNAAYYCAHTTPVRGEIFVETFFGAKRSVGWQLGQNILCTVVDRIDEDRFAFGAVDGDTAAEVEFAGLGQLANYSEQRETAVGWYSRATTDLHCVSVKGPWGPGSVDPSFLKIDGDELLRPYSDRQVCKALTPHLSHQLECGPAKYNPLVVRETTVRIPANFMQPGQLFNHTCEYVQESQPGPGPEPGPNDNGFRNIEVQVENDFGLPQAVRWDITSYAEGNRSSTIYWDNGRNIGEEELRIRFQPEAYLNTPPDFVLSVQQLRDLNPNVPFYDSERNVYTFKVVYGRQRASYLACVVTQSSDGSQYTGNFYGWFNGFEPANREESHWRYRVVPTDIPVTIGFGWYREGLRSPRPINVKANRYGDGERPPCFVGTYIQENRVAELRIGTFSQQGEIFLNGNSIGHSASTNGQRDVFVNVDIFLANNVAFETVGGVTPRVQAGMVWTNTGQFTFVAQDPANPDQPGTLPWQSTTEVLAEYLP